jgi:hypothetical protein
MIQAPTAVKTGAIIENKLKDPGFDPLTGKLQKLLRGRKRVCQ